MIIYGSKSKLLIQEALPDSCPHCGTKNSLTLSVFQKYAHVFWIPLFPMSKIGVSQCDHCKQVLEHKEMPSTLLSAYENLKAQTKTPLWAFSGLVLLAVIIVLAVIQSNKKADENLQFVTAPKVGDIYEVKVENGQYTIFKVNAVKSDSVYVQYSNFQVNKITGLHTLKSDTYAPDIFGYSKQELRNMLDSGTIYGIDRE
jgi:hypothetical protein